MTMSANEYLNHPNILKPTLVEFNNENYLKNILNNRDDKKLKVTVIEIPTEWFDSYFNESDIKIRCDDIKISTLIKQKFTKIKDTEAFLFKREDFVESHLQSRKRKKNGKKKYYSVKEYERLIEQYRVEADISLTDDENYLKFLNDNKTTALYAPDVEFSLFRDYKGDQQWNLNKLKGLIHRFKDENGQKVPGIHTPYMYFGSTYSTFPSHREDGNFLSINIHYYGANKIWYVVSEEDSVRFQNLVNTILLKVYPESICKNLMDHKLFVVTEPFLQKNKINYTKVIQKPRTIVITHPFGIHGGFNLGFNINEAVNFTTVEAVKYFANNRTCKCENIVRLNGEKIIKEKYPTYYELENRKEKHAILGNPDDPKVIEEKKKQRDLNLAIGRKILYAKRSENVQFTLDTIKHWLKFLLTCNPYPHLTYPNEKQVKAFQNYCKKIGHSLQNHEKCNYTKFKSRLYPQIYNPIFEKKDNFGLCDEELKEIIEKFKKPS